MDIFSYMLGKKSGGGSSGGADWNAPEGTAGYIKNRTHYEEVTEVGGDTLTWDGNTEGKEAAVTNLGILYHVSEAVPSAAELQNGYSFTAIDGSGGSSSSVQEANGALVLEGGLGIIIPTDNLEIGGGIVFPKRGVYLMAAVASLTIPGYTGFKTVTTTVKTLDPKYLPEALQFGEDKAFEPIVWDVNGEYEEIDCDGFMYYKIADYSTLGVEQIETITMKINDGGQIIDATLSIEELGGFITEEHGWEAVQGQLYGSDGQQEFSGIVFPEGVWFCSMGVYEYISINPATTVKPLDEKYLPTLTSPSGKKYKLTVDDNGTVSAVEVTG